MFSDFCPIGSGLNNDPAKRSKDLGQGSFEGTRSRLARADTRREGSGPGYSTTRKSTPPTLGVLPPSPSLSHEPRSEGRRREKLFGRRSGRFFRQTNRGYNRRRRKRLDTRSMSGRTGCSGKWRVRKKEERERRSLAGRGSRRREKAGGFSRGDNFRERKGKKKKKEKESTLSLLSRGPSSRRRFSSFFVDGRGWRIRRMESSRVSVTEVKRRVFLKATRSRLSGKISTRSETVALTYRER